MYGKTRGHENFTHACVKAHPVADMPLPPALLHTNARALKQLEYQMPAPVRYGHMPSIVLALTQQLAKPQSASTACMDEPASYCPPAAS